MRMIFVNLPVKDLESSKRFFGELGFDFDPQFTDETAACMVIDENIYAMLLTEERFRDFIDGEIADPDTTEVLVALSADNREEVDSLVEKALAAGGRPWKDTLEQGPMYERSFRDPDGHVWEVIHMEQPAG
jgi:predicted lactoylglutathione lyase